MLELVNKMPVLLAEYLQFIVTLQVNIWGKDDGYFVPVRWD